MMVILNALTIYHSPLLTIAPNVIKLSLPQLVLHIEARSLAFLNQA